MSNLQIVSDFKGVTKVTCKEAVRLLKQGKTLRVLFRPDGKINWQDADNDPAYVWLEEER